MLRDRRFGWTGLLLAGLAALTAGATAPRPATRTARPPAAPTSKPAPPDTTANRPGVRAMNDLAFLAGRWYGELRSYPMQMDVSIDGQATRPGQQMNFTIHAQPAPGFSLGIEGDYRSSIAWSERSKALRALLTDAGGRGVELLGDRVAGATEWLFSSTAEGAPFPFKVRLKPVTRDQIVLDYSSGGRMPLKYAITFNRVPS